MAAARDWARKGAERVAGAKDSTKEALSKLGDAHPTAGAAMHKAGDVTAAGVDGVKRAATKTTDYVSDKVGFKRYRDTVDAALEEALTVIAAQRAEIRSLQTRVEALERSRG